MSKTTINVTVMILFFNFTVYNIHHSVCMVYGVQAAIFPPFCIVWPVLEWSVGSALECPIQYQPPFTPVQKQQIQILGELLRTVQCSAVQCRAVQCCNNAIEYLHWMFNCSPSRWSNSKWITVQCSTVQWSNVQYSTNVHHCAEVWSVMHSIVPTCSL